MVAIDKQWYTLSFLGLSTTYNGYKTSKYIQNLKFPIITH